MLPTCSGARDGNPTADQKSVLGNVFASARNSGRGAVPARWPFDAGIVQTGQAGSSATRSAVTDPVAVAAHLLGRRR